MNQQQIDQLAINTIRTLSMDAIEKANSGHPGLPMGAAPMAYVLWSKFLKHNPQNPHWFDRDRFVLSAGHGSMLLYSLLHLSGYDLSLDELKNFRQWGSKTPGHPEYGHTVGVEATTGPLGQGIGMAVGMAMAERHLASVYNQEENEIINHYTYALCGDGDLMEGVALEAISLAGHLQLGRLIVLYDSNDISLDGDLHKSFTDNVKMRFEASGWQYLRVEDGNNVAEIEAAIAEGQKELGKPTLIEVRTIIGYGSPNRAGKNTAHGAPLGAEELRLTKENYAWQYAEEFHVPEEVRTHFATLLGKNKEKEVAWQAQWQKYQEAYPELAATLQLAMDNKLPEGWENNLPSFETGKAVATRASSGQVINALAGQLPMLIGGSADLASSNNTMIKGAGDYQAGSYQGRNLWFGVREHAMGAALNGMALHGGLRVYGATFFVFSDYLRPAIRLSALQQLPVTYVFTHDSIAVGEDGPTHEPIEQLPSLRAMPGLCVFRPADANETKAAWQLAMESTNQPHVLVLSRQNLPTLTETEDCTAKVAKGAYVLAETAGKAVELILLATGSEVSLAMQAKEQLEQEGYAVRVVSMPSWDRFDQQNQAYKDEVLPPQLTKRLALEMAYPQGWEKYVSSAGKILGIHTFGASAPGSKVLEEYGFTVQNVVKLAKELL